MQRVGLLVDGHIFADVLHNSIVSPPMTAQMYEAMHGERLRHVPTGLSLSPCIALYI